MEKIGVASALGHMAWFVLFVSSFAVAQNEQERILEESQPFFKPKNGDRVVFLGNSLFENDQHYGYIEFVLTSRWPDLDITFRNLGWTGDTVFGDARGHFTNPPGAYELLIEQLVNARPTVVFVAYGANEADKGVPNFNLGLNHLLDKIDGLGAKSILLSPIPQVPSEFPVNIEERNKNLALYSSAIAKVASERDLLFVDIFGPFQEIATKVKLSENGIHLNETGYYHLASLIEEGLGLPARTWSAGIDIPKHTMEATVRAALLDPGKGDASLKFTVDDDMLPLPLPKQEWPMNNNARMLKIKGLKRGYYTLTVDGIYITSASAKKWAEGVEIGQGTSFDQSSQLRDLILKKNELFFHQYRPLNETYITGFRSYEQGKHLQGLEELGTIIEWLEGQISGIRMPKPNVYQLTPLQ